MTDEQYRSLRQLILDMKVEIESLKLHLRKQDEIATFRHTLVYEWCAPADYKRSVEAEISIPGDTLDEFLARIKDQN